MRSAASERVRIYQILRSAHLERAHQQVPATILYRDRRYDFDASLARGLDLRQVNALSMARFLASTPVRTVEVNEPLMLSGLPLTAMAIVAVRMGSLARRRRVRIVCYAIENRDPYRAQRPRAMKTRMRRAGEGVLSRFVARSVDRITYGTDGAARLYRTALARQLTGADSIIVQALPARCECWEHQSNGSAIRPVNKDRDRVLFVGALQPRKGLPQLIEAWPTVQRLRPHSKLTIIGTGALLPAAEAFAAADPSVNLVIDPPRAQIHAALREASVLVLLSQPTSTWREQVGLPIVEALSHGCTVVTTSETGLAQWLGEHGHTVLDPASAVTEFGEAIVNALDANRDYESVLADLPVEDGRIDADRWLFAD